MVGGGDVIYDIRIFGYMGSGLFLGFGLAFWFFEWCV